YSEMAMAYLEALVLNKTVEIKTYSTDRHNTTLGVVYVEGININLKMLKRGLAEVHSKDLPKDFDLKPYYWHEAAAKNSRRHMWRQGDKYISPREWRKRQKE
ncbi:MAG: thermonuclease family protein, partial [Alphaproteobacteria bacterium]|nr:thermonuclease family protein [Alphaproteobacteria bacterium]